MLILPTLNAPPYVLREFREIDLDLIEEAASDPLHSFTPEVYTRDEGLAYIERQHDRARAGTGYSFVITYTRSGQSVGSIGLWLNQTDGGRASLGYWVAPSKRGNGIAAISLAAIVNWNQDELKIPRLELDVEPSNLASIKTAEAAGFFREGLLRKWRPFGDERRDMLMYAHIG